MRLICVPDDEPERELVRSLCGATLLSVGVSFPGERHIFLSLSEERLIRFSHDGVAFASPLLRAVGGEQLDLADPSDLGTGAPVRWSPIDRVIEHVGLDWQGEPATSGGWLIDALVIRLALAGGGMIELTADPLDPCSADYLFVA